MVGDKLAQLEPRRGCPVLITNETSKAFELKKGNVVAQLIEVGEGDQQVEEEIDNQAWDSSPVAEEIRCSDEYRPLITKIVSENRDVFAMQSLAGQTL